MTPERIATIRARCEAAEVDRYAWINIARTDLQDALDAIAAQAEEIGQLKAQCEVANEAAQFYNRKAADAIVLRNSDLDAQTTVLIEKDARIAELQQRLRQASLTAHSVTFGEIPANLREAEIWEPHEWDNFTVWQQRDSALRVASQAVTQRDAEVEQCAIERGRKFMTTTESRTGVFIRSDDAGNFHRALMRLIEISGEGWIPDRADLIVLEALAAALTGSGHSPHHDPAGDEKELGDVMIAHRFFEEFLGGTWRGRNFMSKVSATKKLIAIMRTDLQAAREALKELSLLGGGGIPGNSDGNRIAQRALAAIDRAGDHPSGAGNL